MGIVILILFCYLLYRAANERGVPSLSYIVNFVAFFFLGILGFAIVFISWFGVESLQNIAAFEKEIMFFQLLSVVFEVLLFLFFRMRIKKAGPVINEDDDYTPPTAKPKKDLSYFR